MEGAYGKNVDGVEMRLRSWMRANSLVNRLHTWINKLMMLLLGG